LCVIKNESKIETKTQELIKSLFEQNRQKKTTDKKLFFSFFERKKKPIINFSRARNKKK